MRLVIKIAISIVILFYPAYCQALIGDIRGNFGLDGSFRSIGTVTDYARLPSFFTGARNGEEFSGNILRLTAGGRPNNRLIYEFHLVQEFDYTTDDRDFQIFPLPEANRYQALDLTWRQHDERHTAAMLYPDRFNIKFTLPAFDLTLGRQAITFGKAYFWNPLDVFLPFGPEQLDRDYKAGVDAVRLDIPLGNFSGLNLIGVSGRRIPGPSITNNHEKTFDVEWYGSSLMARGFTTIGNFDLALQLGKIYGGYQIGAATAGEYKLMEIRLEAAYFNAVDSDPLPLPYTGYLFEDHFTFVAGLGRTFANTFAFELEYLYNGAADPESLEASLLRVGYGASLQLSRHLLGLMLKYDIIPIVTAQLVGIYSLSDDSYLVQPALDISVSDEVELILSATLGFGNRPEQDLFMIPRLKSEFGTYPDTYLAEIKWYF